MVRPTQLALGNMMEHSTQMFSRWFMLVVDIG
jgi:hypothetical protein